MDSLPPSLLTIPEGMPLCTKRVLMRPCLPAEAPKVVELYQRNWPVWCEWDPPAPQGLFEVSYWERRLTDQLAALTTSSAVPFWMFDASQPDGQIIGAANFSSVVRGPFQACFLGYKLAEEYWGRGLMTEALEAAIAWVFEHLGLHRIMANYIPRNEKSGAVLKRLGFQIEGYARDYLFIEDRWQDHVLTALTNPDPQPPNTT